MILKIINLQKFVTLACLEVAFLKVVFSEFCSVIYRLDKLRLLIELDMCFIFICPVIVELVVPPTAPGTIKLSKRADAINR